MEDLAYMAGIVDGEGSIVLTRKYRNGMPIPVLAVDSTDPELLDWIKETFGGSIKTKKKYAAHHRQAYTWTLTRRQALGLLEKLLPFLKLHRKRARVELLLECYLAATPRNGKYTAHHLALHDEMRTRWDALASTEFNQ